MEIRNKVLRMLHRCVVQMLSHQLLLHQSLQMGHVFSKMVEVEIRFLVLRASSEVEIMGEMPVLPPDSLVTPEAEVAAAGCGAARPAQVVSLGAVSKTERPGEESKLDKKSPMHPENATRGHTADTRGRPVSATTPFLPTENHNVAPVMPVAVASPALPASDEGEPGHKRLRRSSFCDAAPSAAKWWLPIAGRTSATQADRDSVPELRQSARAAAAPSSQRQMRNAFQMLASDYGAETQADTAISDFDVSDTQPATQR
ncbi:unnamed protein product [Prorocentrum cordatum]|uniref:Uncharacterized protein n=1 Tax=Prorocentrum cordatum TaxID=2364126 RepID=A0ABN9WPX0_9DINO|nr:unnamed protein product [Polarella glacialis]